MKYLNRLSESELMELAKLLGFNVDKIVSNGFIVFIASEDIEIKKEKEKIIFSLYVPNAIDADVFELAISDFAVVEGDYYHKTPTKAEQEIFVKYMVNKFKDEYKHDFIKYVVQKKERNLSSLKQKTNELKTVTDKENDELNELAESIK